MSKKNDPFSIALKPEKEWEDEGQPSISPDELSDKAIEYLSQIQELQQQLAEEQIKIQRLEMAIRGFTMALQEEIKGL